MADRIRVFRANYHEYTHGPVRDEAGNYYFLLNLTHDHYNERTSRRAGSPFMGSMDGFRGWACRVTPQGKFETYASGLRSLAGVAFDPQGRLWYAENQGEYVGSSKWVPLEQGKFYGHIYGLVSLLIGQTGRGWGAVGGSVDKLQQIVWDGKTVAADIQSAVAAKDGFTLRFTNPFMALRDQRQNVHETRINTVQNEHLVENCILLQKCTISHFHCRNLSEFWRPLTQRPGWTMEFVVAREGV